jgi:hypothetical protein
MEWETWYNMGSGENNENYHRTNSRMDSFDWSKSGLVETGGFWLVRICRRLRRRRLLRDSRRISQSDFFDTERISTA